MPHRTIQAVHACLAIEILSLEAACNAIARSLVRLREGFEELSNIAGPDALPLRLDLDGEVA